MLINLDYSLHDYCFVQVINYLSGVDPFPQNKNLPEPFCQSLSGRLADKAALDICG